MAFLDGRRQRHVCSTKRDTNERRNKNGKDEEKGPWKGGNVDRRVEARSEQSRVFGRSLSNPPFLISLSGDSKHHTLAPDCSLRASTRRST